VPEGGPRWGARRPGSSIDEVGPALYLLHTVPSARGAVSFFTILMLLVLAVGGYLGWLLVPLWLDNLDMREASTATLNRLASNPDVEAVRVFYLDRSKRIGTHWVTEGGTRVEKPGLGLTADDIVIERDPFEHTAHIQVDYQREVKLWPTERFATFDFHVEKAGRLPQ
jgi:hypothetical protein